MLNLVGAVFFICLFKSRTAKTRFRTVRVLWGDPKIYAMNNFQEFSGIDKFISLGARLVSL